MSEKILYFCVGCRQVHYDEDYCLEDGDLRIVLKNRFFESVDKVKKQLNSSKN